MVSLLTLFLRPEDAFDEMPDRPSLLSSGLVVFALGVVLAMQSIPLMVLAVGDGPTHTFRLAMGSGVVTVTRAVPFNLAFTIGTAVVAWLVLGAVTYAGARTAGGTGSVRDTLAAVAWCAVPWILVYGLSIAIATVTAVTSNTTAAAVLGGHVLDFVPGNPPAYFDGRGVLDLRTWLSVAGVVLSARIWARAVPSVHGDGLARVVCHRCDSGRSDSSGSIHLIVTRC